MNRLVIASAVAAAAAAVSVPAFAGLANNPSFSHGVPVKVPSDARLIHFDNKGDLVSVRHGSDDPASTELPSAPGSHAAAPGDDRGGATQPSDDRGGATQRSDEKSAATQPSDDNGGATQPSDDNGGASLPAGDHGGNSGHGG